MRRGFAWARPPEEEDVAGTSREDREEVGLVMERDGRGDAGLFEVLIVFEKGYMAPFLVIELRLFAI